MYDVQLNAQHARVYDESGVPLARRYRCGGQCPMQPHAPPMPPLVDSRFGPMAPTTNALRHVQYRWDEHSVASSDDRRGLCLAQLPQAVDEALLAEDFGMFGVIESVQLHRVAIGSAEQVAS